MRICSYIQSIFVRIVRIYIHTYVRTYIIYTYNSVCMYVCRFGYKLMGHNNRLNENFILYFLYIIMTYIFSYFFAEGFYLNNYILNKKLLHKKKHSLSFF